MKRRKAKSIRRLARAFGDSADGSCLASSAVREPPTAYRREPATTLRSERAVKSATLRRASALENTFSAFASAGDTTWLTNDDPGIGVPVPSSMVRAARKISAAVIRRASRASLYPPCHPRTPFIEDEWPSASFCRRQDCTSHTEMFGQAEINDWP